jgi:hypothetical protein
MFLCILTILSCLFYYILLTLTTINNDAIACLSGRDLSSYEFISVTRQGGFIPVSLKPIDNRLNIIM